MYSKPLSKHTRLELGDMSLRLFFLKRQFAHQYEVAEQELSDAITAAFDAAGVSEKEFDLDLDRCEFVPRPRL